MELDELQKYLDSKAKALGFSHYGISSLSRPLTFEIYENWLVEGLHGNMEYLVTHAPLKEKPQIKWPRACSAFVFAVPYYPHPAETPSFPLKAARVSLYARGYDYHHWFRAKLQNICDELKALLPEEEFIPMTDSSPVLERDLAFRAGIGWVGKNTCVIHPKNGSLFFIGEIYSSLSFQLEPQLVHDFCGNCTRCIDICPTQALTEARKLDARKCISYLTIESREVPPEDLREKMGDWFFGCDLCQITCPWNQKAFKNQFNIKKMEHHLESHNPERATALEEELRWILSSSGKQIERSFKGLSMSRAGGFGLKRNALIVAGNRKITALKKEVENLCEHPKLEELAKWTLSKLEK